MRIMWKRSKDMIQTLMIVGEKEVEVGRVLDQNSGRNQNEKLENLEAQLRGNKDIIQTAFNHLVLTVHFTFSFSLRT
jgi:hypothetical protein